MGLDFQETGGIMKEIKFRVIVKGKIFGYEWLEDGQWKHIVCDLDIDENGKILRTTRGTIIFPVRGERNQYTGLKDKNGTEIYEGDIAKYIFNEKSKVVSIDYSEYIASFVMLGLEEWPCRFTDKTELAVIGNIYENPELLGGE
jgi:hypothetical protein